MFELFDFSRLVMKNTTRLFLLVLLIPFAFTLFMALCPLLGLIGLIIKATENKINK